MTGKCINAEDWQKIFVCKAWWDFRKMAQQLRWENVWERRQGALIPAQRFWRMAGLLLFTSLVHEKRSKMMLNLIENSCHDKYEEYPTGDLEHGGDFDAGRNFCQSHLTHISVRSHSFTSHSCLVEIVHQDMYILDVLWWLWWLFFTGPLPYSSLSTVNLGWVRLI